jgi:hypothetical protein
MLEKIENHVLLTRKGGRHTSFSTGGETAAVMERLLLTREIPVAGTVFDS